MSDRMTAEKIRDTALNKIVSVRETIKTDCDALNYLLYTVDRVGKDGGRVPEEDRLSSLLFVVSQLEELESTLCRI